MVGLFKGNFFEVKQQSGSFGFDLMVVTMEPLEIYIT
jgi:hypothetical protein